MKEPFRSVKKIWLREVCWWIFALPTHVAPRIFKLFNLTPKIFNIFILVPEQTRDVILCAKPYRMKPRDPKFYSIMSIDTLKFQKLQIHPSWYFKYFQLDPERFQNRHFMGRTYNSRRSQVVIYFRLALWLHCSLSTILISHFEPN